MAKYTKEFLISELQRYYKEFNKIPSCIDFHKSINGFPTTRPYKTNFGTWSNALLEAGFQTYEQRNAEVHIINYCKQCNKEIHTTKIRNQQFCNSSCAAKYNNTDRIVTQESKNKMSKSAKNNPSGFCSPEYVRKESVKSGEDKICPCCGEKFYVTKSMIKTHCSFECAKKSGMGGLREKSGRGKQGYYKGFFLNSTYELAYVIYCLDHNISIERNKESFDYYNQETNKWHKFYPDFIINGELVEIKGVRSKLNNYKLSGVKDRKISILYKNDLKEIFNYVENKTGIKINNLYQLYDGHKPKYQYECDCCHKTFSREKIIKTETKFCSNSCSGKYRAKIRLASRDGYDPSSPE